MNLFIVIGYKGEDVAQVVGDINENLTKAKVVLADNVEDYDKLEIWSRNQGCVREKKLSNREGLKLIVVQKNKGKIKQAEAETQTETQVQTTVEAREAPAVAKETPVEVAKAEEVGEVPAEDVGQAASEAETPVAEVKATKAKSSTKSTKATK